MTPAAIIIGITAAYLIVGPLAAYVTTQLRARKKARAAATAAREEDKLRAAERTIVTGAEDMFFQGGAYFTPRGVLVEGDALHDWIMVRTDRNPHRVVHAWKDCPACLADRREQKGWRFDQEKVPEDVGGKTPGPVSEKTPGEKGGNRSARNADGVFPKTWSEFSAQLPPENVGGETSDSFREKCWSAVTGNWDPLKVPERRGCDWHEEHGYGYAWTCPRCNRGNI